jgi:hypothetical protein
MLDNMVPFVEVDVVLCCMASHAMVSCYLAWRPSPWRHDTELAWCPSPEHHAKWLFFEVFSRCVSLYVEVPKRTSLVTFHIVGMELWCPPRSTMACGAMMD